MSRARVCIFGEVLFDHFPDGSRVLGGAPFNVAWHLQAFGQQPLFISRVGTDTEGAQIRQAMRDWNMDLGGLQTDAHLETGRVKIAFDDGEPHYDIVHPCAYDAIEPSVSDGCSLLYHGSLAVRSPASMKALQRLLDNHTGQRFVDVNLRPPWWTMETLLRLLPSADWVKLNTDELNRLSGETGEAAADDFLHKHRLKGLIVTHGAAGAEAFTAEGGRTHVEPEPSSRVVDTVGAGDAFASVIILGLLNDWPLATMLRRAQQFASQIVTRRGATVSDPAFYRAFLDDWALIA